MTRREVDHAWTEEGELPGKVTLEFEGVNTAAFEAMEIQNFQRGLSEPQEDDPGSGDQNVESGGGRGSPAQLLVSFVLGLVLAAIGYGVSSSFEIFKGRENAIAFGSFFVGVFTPMVVGAARTGRARDKGDVVPERITVEMTSDALTVQGTTVPHTSIPMRDIAEVLAAPRLGWRDRSGRFTLLPCGLATNAESTALANRLQALVQQAHSLSGYRGG